MDKDQQDQLKFLVELLRWSREQDRILDEINVKLHEMKEIAEYTLKYELTRNEIEELNGQFNDLKGVVHSLEKQLHSVVH
jgi:polyhydroxyalkanoate synthesis regulator phasin